MHFCLALQHGIHLQCGHSSWARNAHLSPAGCHAAQRCSSMWKATRHASASALLTLFQLALPSLHVFTDMLASKESQHWQLTHQGVLS